MSYDVWKHSNAQLEFHGTDGSISAPDPNTFGGKVMIARTGDEWSEVPLGHGPADNARSIGLADLCIGIRSGHPHRCNGNMAQHVIDVMEAFDRSATNCTQIAIESRPQRPPTLAAPN